MKITNTKIFGLVLGFALLMQSTVQAQDLGKVLGTAWTIGNDIVGTTTLTPAYAVQTWYQRIVIKVPTAFGNSDVTLKVRRDLFGVYFYDTKIIIAQSWPKPNPTESTNVFAVNSVDKLNLSCSLGVGSTITTVQTATEKVWLDSVTRTGLWPDNGPWTVYLKTGGTPTSCSGNAPISNYYFWVPASVSLGGAAQVVSLGRPNATLNFPFYLANDFYK